MPENPDKRGPAILSNFETKIASTLPLSPIIFANRTHPKFAMYERVRGAILGEAVCGRMRNRADQDGHALKRGANLCC